MTTSLPDPNSVVDLLSSAFQSDKADGIEATIQLRITGPEARNYYLQIKDKAISGGEGIVEKPRVTISANLKDLLNIFEGRLDPMTAYFQGRLIVQGDLSFAMKLAGLFKRKK